MARKLHIRPVEGKRVRIPYTSSFLPAAGSRVTCDQYWLIRLKEGDVEYVPEARPHIQEKRTPKVVKTPKTEPKIDTFDFKDDK